VPASGVRSGGYAGLVREAVDLDVGTVHLLQVAEETPGGVRLRPYPKTRAGIRTGPLPAALAAHRRRWILTPAPTDLVFPTRYGTPMLRGNFRREVCAPALARAGLSATFRFHDLRHSYAAWLITDGVPVNVVQKVIGPSTGTHTRAPADYADVV
jgi:integrase